MRSFSNTYHNLSINEFGKRVYALDLISPACNDDQSKISSIAETIKLPVRDKFLIEFI
jgi:hypothetical protein